MLFFVNIRPPKKCVLTVTCKKNLGSIVLQLLQVLDKWTEILDKGGCVDTIYCDFMKAFDKVPQLEKYQITGQFSGWIIS
jgi:hypothetical protein